MSANSGPIKKFYYFLSSNQETELILFIYWAEFWEEYRILSRPVADTVHAQLKFYKGLDQLKDITAGFVKWLQSRFLKNTHAYYSIIIVTFHCGQLTQL